MSYISITQEQLKEFQDLEVEGPFQMFNLLKFKEAVEETGTSGAQAYAEYMNAVLPFFQKSGANLVYQGKPILSLIGPKNKEWDKVLIIEYASKTAFLSMITSEGYPAKLRERALKDSRLILCKS